MKKIFLLFLTLFLLFFASCTTSTNKSSDYLPSFNGGDTALSFDFGENTPPDTVRDQSLQPFSVRISVQNQGETDIAENSGYVVLTGFNPSELNLNQTSKPLNALRGNHKQGDNVISGGQQQVIFDNLKYTSDIFSGSLPLTIYANICYPYKTRSVALLCINGDTTPSIDDRTKICDLEGERPFANSGAPVKIDNVKQYSGGTSKIQFQFDIVHVPSSDNAILVESGSIDSRCKVNGKDPSSSEVLTSVDKVRYNVSTGIPGLSCSDSQSGNGEATLYGGDPITVTCIQDTTDQPEYEKAVSIQLEYDYIDRVGKTITIQHIDQ